MTNSLYHIVFPFLLFSFCLRKVWVRLVDSQAPESPSPHAHTHFSRRLKEPLAGEFNRTSPCRGRDYFPSRCYSQENISYHPDADSCPDYAQQSKREISPSGLATYFQFRSNQSRLSKPPVPACPAGGDTPVALLCGGALFEARSPSPGDFCKLSHSLLCS